MSSLFLPEPQEDRPQQRQTAAAKISGSPCQRIPKISSAAVFFVLVLLCAEQAWRPDAAREREVLGLQVADAIERLDRLQAERRVIEAQRAAVAEIGVPRYKPPRHAFIANPHPALAEIQDHERRRRHLEDAALTGVPITPAMGRSEPIRSTEHALYLIDKRLKEIDEDIARVVHLGQRHSKQLDEVELGGGRRVSFANQLLAKLGEMFK